MLSILSSKQQHNQSKNNKNKNKNNNNNNDLPQIVDFNTIEEPTIESDHPQSTSFFSLWPFNRSRATTNKANDNDDDSLLDDSTNKVIAMKKIDSSLLNESSINNDNDEDFIDIQLRQLSYAEVAALNNSKSNSNNQIVVIDQEDVLGKSITDIEMVKTLKNCEKFNIDLIPLNNNNHPTIDNSLSEDQWDIYNESLSKNHKKSNLKSKKHKKRPFKKAIK